MASLKYYFPDQDEKDLATLSSIQNILFPTAQYTVTGVLGKGAYGIIYKVVGSNQREYACKIGTHRQEFEIQQLFNQHNMSPTVWEILSVPQYPNVWLCIMDTVHSTLKKAMDRQEISEESIYNALKCIIKKKYLFQYPSPILHADFHIDNIVVLNDGKTLGIIDFAFARTAPPVYQLLDVLSLAGSINEYSARTQSYTSLTNNLLKFFNYLFSLAKTPLQSKYIMKKNKIFYVYWKDDVEVALDYDFFTKPFSVRVNDETVQKILRVFPTLQLPFVQSGDL
jgi:serine/threonine protein kinase